MAHLYKIQIKARDLNGMLPESYRVLILPQGGIIGREAMK